MLAASAAVLTVACAMASRERCPIDAAHPSAHAGLWFAWGWWVAGVLCAVIAAVQYFAPAWSAVFLDAGLLAYSTAPGRAVGNMRQPNHLATALVCAMVWTAWLRHIRRLSAAACGASIVATVFAVSLSASRTGALSLGMLLLWALVDRRLPRSARWLLALTPLIYLACWLGLAEWAAWAQTQYYGADRLQSGSDPSSSRFAIWKNAITLLAQHPWTGVGWGHFNFAWTFTPFPDRPTAFFDHTHNLPLQLAVEIGLPATVLVLGLFAWSMWQARGAWSGDRADPNREQSPARAALVMLVVLGVHSLLEYPLWYAYFLLPAAWALGLFIGSAPVPAGAKPMSATAQRWTARLLALAGVAMIAGALYALWDHRRIERIFEANAGDAPLAERIADGRRSKLFGHHADYAAVTNEPKDMNLASFRRPLLQLVDTRLLIAYIEALKATGEDRKALYAAQRLREFQRADAQAYFRDCDSPTPPFQCERAPVTGLTWRDMIPPAATNDSGR
ncbi:MAG TPA: Wzy polymerase domain-containing protein [Methylibium sp.]|uniref:PglL family O-oligosaccharyltransferase n=1 Tax=Methylibium sp. TaxID=2067992 RepID=UPI002DBB4F21|nr:Wzy polymerase domain-containing protein [Methylibium sp.]HEU4458882.1 Wzy polymerase domain-containing protein [Methylibium sp.]